jgi:hypothetical protein
MDIQVHFHFSNSFSFFEIILVFQIHFSFSKSFSFFKIIFNLWNHFQNIFNFWIYFQLGFNIQIDYQFVFKSNLVIDFWKKVLEKVFVSHPISLTKKGIDLLLNDSNSIKNMSLQFDVEHSELLTAENMNEWKEKSEHKNWQLKLDFCVEDTNCS